MWLLHQTSRLSSTPTPFALSFKSKSAHQGIFHEKVPFLQRRLVHPGGCQGFVQLTFASIKGRGSPADPKSRHKYGNDSWAEGWYAHTPTDCGQHLVSPLFVFHKYPTWFLYLHDCWIHSFKVYRSLCPSQLRLSPILILQGEEKAIPIQRLLLCRQSHQVP